MSEQTFPLLDALSGQQTLVRVRVLADAVYFLNDANETLGIVEAIDGEIRFFTYIDNTTEDFRLTAIPAEVGMK